MITNTDWNAALDAWMYDERERLGGPPTPEEIVAWKRGDLDEAEATRVRALLVYYPELTSLITDPLEDVSAPIAAPVVNPEIAPVFAPAAVLRFPHTFAPPFAIAAMLAVTMLTTLLVRERNANTRPEVFASRIELTSSHARGPVEIAHVPANQKHVLITAVLSQQSDQRAYRIEIAREDGTVIWTAQNVQTIDGAFEINLPVKALGSGTYTLTASDGRGRAEQFAFAVK